MIFRWVEKNNTALAYLHFTGPNNKLRGDRLFSHVSKEDPMTTKKQNFSGRRDFLDSDEENSFFLKKEEHIDDILSRIKQE
jgi:hypothetical protein